MSASESPPSSMPPQSPLAPKTSDKKDDKNGCGWIMLGGLILGGIYVVYRLFTANAVETKEWKDLFIMITSMVGIGFILTKLFDQKKP